MNQMFIMFLTSLVGSCAQAVVTPTKTYTTNETIKRFSPEVRECYTDDEVQLKHLKSSIGFRYSMKNCLLDIALDHLLKNCSCTFSVLKIDNVEVKSLTLTLYKIIIS